MKIVKVIYSLGFGGVEKVFEIVARYHAGDKADIVFLVLAGGGPTEKAIREMGYRVEVMGYRARIPDVRLLVRLVRFFRREKPQVVHTSGAEANFHGILAAALARVPVRIAEEVGMPAHSKPAKVVFGLVYRFADCVIAVARLVEKYLLESGEAGPSRVRLLYNPVDVHAFAGIRRQPADAVFRIITVCRLDPIKNLDLLLNGVCRSGQPSVELWIVGDGPERARLQQHAESLGLGTRVTFWGYQERPAGFFTEASLFVLPSFSEGLPVSLAEAMLTGTPCVATRIGGAPEFIEPGVNGWLIDPYDEAAFSGLLTGIMAMPPEERSSIGQKGRQTVMDRLMPETYLDRVRDLYADLYAKSTAH